MSVGKSIRANRNFDQLKRGDVVIVDVDDAYWKNQVLAGNITIVDGLVDIPAEPEVPEDVYEVFEDQELSELLSDELSEEVEDVAVAEDDLIPESDPED